MFVSHMHARDIFRSQHKRFTVVSHFSTCNRRSSFFPSYDLVSSPAGFLIARRAVAAEIGVKISDVYYERLSREKQRENDGRVSQQRRGAKRQSGFMIFSQRHLSRAIFPRPKSDERAEAARAFDVAFLTRPTHDASLLLTRAPCLGPLNKSSTSLSCAD